MSLTLKLTLRMLFLSVGTERQVGIVDSLDFELLALNEWEEVLKYTHPLWYIPTNMHKRQIVDSKCR